MRVQELEFHDVNNKKDNACDNWDYASDDDSSQVPPSHSPSPEDDGSNWHPDIEQCRPAALPVALRKMQSDLLLHGKSTMRDLHLSRGEDGESSPHLLPSSFKSDVRLRSRLGGETAPQ